MARRVADRNRCFNARVHRPLAEVVAHRGASAYAPENTFAAFDLALAQGADVLELDVRPAADGHLVLVHDPTLERIAGDPRAVAGLSRGALETLDELERRRRGARRRPSGTSGHMSVRRRDRRGRRGFQG